MKKILKITAFLLFCTTSLHAQVDTKGTDFWLTFGQNGPNATSLVNMQIRIVGSDQLATGTIYFTNISASVTFTVAAGGVFTHNLDATQKTAVYNTATGTNNRSVHITSSAPVTVYAVNVGPQSTDATNVLPVTALGTDYYQISYMPYSSYPDAYAVIATANNTVINHNGSPVATINTGQVYYFSGAAGADMTGARITTDKPAAFFMLNQAAYIPVGYSGRDNLFQQLAPVNTWGKNFFVPVSYLGKDIIRIVASQSGTNITQTGGTLLSPAGGQPTLNNLSAGQWVELEVQLASNGCFIQSNNPIGVCTYLTSMSYHSGSVSDPAMAWLPSIEQSVNSALIAPFVPAIGSTSMLDAHYAMVITPTNTKNSTKVSIKGAAATSLFGGSWVDHSSGNSFYSMPLTIDTVSYFFTNSEGGLFVMGYGTGTNESYYYMAASAMRNLDVSYTIKEKATNTNTHYTMTNVNSHSFKYVDTVVVNRTIEKGFLDVHWLLNSSTYSISENLGSSTNMLKFPASALAEGANTITMAVRFIGATADSLYSGIVWVIPDTLEICAGKTVTFEAHPINGGSTPTFQWYKNGAAIPSATAATYAYAPANGDVVKVVVTSNAACASPATVTSHSIIVIAHPLPSVNLSASPSSVCAGGSSTLTANVSGGTTTAMTYTWYVAGSTYTSSSNTYNLSGLNATANYSVKVTNANGCEGSATVTVTVNPLPVVSVTANPNPVCSGNPTTFTATVSSGAVNPMTYTWNIAGTTYSSTTNTYSLTLSGTSSYSVMVTNNNGCASTYTAPQTVTVTPTVVPSISINASTNNVCSGTTVTFSPTTLGGGSSPTYQWYVNGLLVGSGTSYTYAPANNDVVTCKLTSSDTCANPNPVTSAGITMIITPLVIPSLTITAVPD